ncbi:hypothetical protein OG361_04875 [Streptomyces sp. NBC_00090]|uniref:hypothetical protein n=1 Tax=Streptomyces sp. NBC_00090 TaxID=2903619 RepID=UPI00324DA122
MAQYGCHGQRELALVLGLSRSTVTSAYGPSWRPPAGGAALWVRVPGADTETLAQPARRRGVSVVPGTAFSPVDGFRDRLRLPYAHGTAALEAGLPARLECAERATAG